MRLRSVFVEHDASPVLWEMLRQARNQCVDGLTEFRREVSQDHQELYRRTYDDERVRHYLYVDDKEHVVGYGRVEMREGFAWPSCGVVTAHRGKGYGWEVVRRIMMASGADMRGYLLVDNEAIKRIDYTLGWKPVGPEMGGKQYVECRWPPPFTEQQSVQDGLDEIVRFHESAGDGVA